MRPIEPKHLRPAPMLLLAIMMIGPARARPPAAAAGGARPASPARTPAVVQSTEGTAAGTDKEEDHDEEALTLERLFPEKGLFGPSARAAAFSSDGRYAGYLYRPYLERRHGSDLWIYDFQEGRTRRITAVSVMSRFQQATRAVRKDRIKKAKKRAKESSEGAEREVAEDDLTGDWEGRLTADAADFPPGGVSFTLAVRVDADGAVSGTLRSSVSTAAITGGTWDAGERRLRADLGDTESGLTATLRARIEAGTMTGTIRVEQRHLVIALTATRRADDDDDAEQETHRETGKRGREQEQNDGKEQTKHDERDLGDVVDKKDAEDEKAPRYAGVSAYTWSPNADVLIFTSGGDLYRYEVESGQITRLTRTRDPERDVQYLPDGSGYTYLRGPALIRVVFGDHRIDQLDPRLGEGEKMSGYRLSPDGTRLVILATKGESYWSRGRKVNIVNYRKRFAEVRQVTRHVSDDPMPHFEWSVYLYDMTGHLEEKGKPKKVYTHKQSGPRDTMRVPEWAPDSGRVAFAVYEQTSGHVEILEAKFLPPEPDADDGQVEAAAEDEDEEEKPEGPRIEDARPVYRFLHDGGPTTPRMIHPYYLPDSRRMVFMTELSGYRHVHVLDPLYEHLEQLTHGQFEVYPFDISTDHHRLFVLSTRGDPAQQHVAVVDLDSGALERLSIEDGYDSGAAISGDGTRVLANHADFGAPRELVAIDTAAQTTRPITDSHPEEARKLTRFVPEYFTYENRHGQSIHGHMFKPDGWTAQDHRPLLIYVYGGPLGTRKMITRGSFSAPSYFFAYYMARQHGYVTCTIDPRGVSGYGGLYEKSNYEHAGRPQVEDLVDATKWFVANQGVDPKRIGLHGWSFGGFQTQMCLYTEPDAFACGIAGAGPTEWENYNAWYSTGTIGPSRPGKTDLEKFSLLPLAKNLKAKLLLIHGMEDSNVLYQDTVRVYRELLKAGKETLVELFLDPTGNHGLGGDVKTLGRYRKYEEFLLRCLGEGPLPPRPETAPAAGGPPAKPGTPPRRRRGMFIFPAGL